MVQGFTWLKENEDSFDYDNFLKGLDWFMDSTCPGCRGSEETWCVLKKCSKILDDVVYNCLLCEEFSECTFTEYQRNRYSHLFEHIEYITREGFEAFLQREAGKAENSVLIQEIRDY